MLRDVGLLGAAVLVVTIDPGEPSILVDEIRSPAVEADPPKHLFPAPFLVTRYGVSIRQVVVWPDTTEAPAIGSSRFLDVGGGTLNCFTLLVPGAAKLEPNSTYVVAAGVRSEQQLVLWDDADAMPVINETIREAGTGTVLPEALAKLIGQPLK